MKKLKANTFFSQSTTNVAGDILDGGGTGSGARWRGLANWVRLRYLMRISKKKNVVANRQAIVSKTVAQ